MAEVVEDALPRVERDDLKQLRLQLMLKIKQQEQGQLVHVAPVVETQVKPARTAEK